MLKPKYYYSEPYYKALAHVIVDNHGGVIDFLDAYCKEAKPRVTICGIWDTEKNTMSYGYAVCSPEDQFEKKVGRKLAYDRAISKPCVTIYVSDNDSVSKIFINGAMDLETKIMKSHTHTI